MIIQVEPVQISFVRTCSSLDIRILELLEHSIVLYIEFFNTNQESIYKCNLHLSQEEIQEWQKDQLDIIQWVLLKFHVQTSQHLPSLKRKDLEPIDEEISIKKNKLD